MIKVISPGLQSSMQDAGRYSYRSYGVPWSGPMDNFSAGLARELVQNEPNATVLEFYQKGPKLVFEAPAIIVVTGMHFNLMLDKKPLPLFVAHKVRKGQTLEITSPVASNFGYLAIAGGFDVQQRLGSSSYCPGITEEQRLKKGQQLRFHKNDLTLANLNARIKPNTEIFNTDVVRVMVGPEYELLSKQQKELLWNGQHTLSRSINRMGYRFKANSKLGLDGILTGPVQAGTLQLTPSGELIVLMRDAQTTGGYSRILQLLPEDISIIAQQLPGTKLRFELFE